MMTAEISLPKQSLWQKIFNTEFFFDERYRTTATFFLITFAIIYAVFFPGVMQYVAYLGPGLGDDYDLGPYLNLLKHFYVNSQGNIFYAPFFLFVLLSVVNIIFTGAIIIAGYVLYPRLMGKPFPITVLFTYFSLNAACTTGIMLIYVLFGCLASLFGLDFISGFMAFSHLLESLNAYTQAHVPTLVEVPAPLAFFMILMVGGFFHYWFHRLAHESRILWLLFHRTHHMTPELIQPSTQSVFNAFPLFIVAAIPYVIIFGVIGKLITNESILSYLIIYKLLSAFSNMWSHQTALYGWAQKQQWIRVLSTITSEGVYHYLHHSSEPEHNNPRGNLINIGGGCFFFWDRVFGTYRTATDYQPEVGLQGEDRMNMSTNPVRLAFAGILQIAYELINNKSLKTRLLILAGSSDYKPAITKDFALREIITPNAY